MIRTPHHLGVPPDREDADHRGDSHKYSVGQPFIYPRNDLS